MVKLPLRTIWIDGCSSSNVLTPFTSVALTMETYAMMSCFSAPLCILNTCIHSHSLTLILHTFPLSLDSKLTIVKQPNLTRLFSLPFHCLNPIIFLPISESHNSKVNGPLKITCAAQQILANRIVILVSADCSQAFAYASTLSNTYRGAFAQLAC